MSAEPIFDLPQVARARRRHSRGGLDYLLTRVRDELTARWRGLRDDDDNQTENPRRVLIVDDVHSDWQLDADTVTQKTSPLDTPPTSLANLFAADDDDDEANFDDIIIALQLAWLPPEVAIARALRNLRAGGRLLFCTFGPDTLLQLHQVSAQNDYPFVHPFADMHNLGDEILRSGFVDPIVDVDRVTVEYPNAEMLFADLRGEGFTNALCARRKTLTGKTRLRKITDALNAMKNVDGVLPITFELIYGVATAPTKSPFKVTVKNSSPTPPPTPPAAR